MRHKQSSWQTWENYAACAADSGQYQAGARGLTKVLELSSGTRLDMATLTKLVGHLERLMDLCREEEERIAARGQEADPAAGAQGTADDVLALFPGEIRLTDSEDEAAAEDEEDSAGEPPAIFG